MFAFSLMSLKFLTVSQRILKLKIKISSKFLIKFYRVLKSKKSNKIFNSNFRQSQLNNSKAWRPPKTFLKNHSEGDIEFKLYLTIGKSLSIPRLRSVDEPKQFVSNKTTRWPSLNSMMALVCGTCKW